MTRLSLGVGLLLLAASAFAWLARSHRPAMETVYEPPVAKIEPAPPAPWRHADSDLTNWFPGATGFIAHDLILSGKRVQLQQELGRELRPEEMALHVYLVASNATHLGSVLTRRIKAPHGALEIALALDTNSIVRHFRIQRSREPQEVQEALDRLDLSGQLAGKSASDHFSLRLEPAGPGDSGVVATSIAEAVRSLLILHRAGQREFTAPHH